MEQFALLSVIGRGSYGKVYLVRHVTDGRLYALKVLQKERVESKKQQQHVRTERAVLAAARASPFLVGFHGCFQNARKLYFVLEYCPGGELFHRLQRCKRLDEPTAKFYAAQILLALEHLHAHGVLYRDLKPENVLIAADGYVKLSDFGLSRTGLSGEEARSLLGTPEYLAPEVLLRKAYGRAVDWWTFGSLLFEMLTGLPPFYARNRACAELFERIKFAAPKFPPYVAGETRALLEALLRKEPTERLGVGGAAEVRAHAWFRGVDFEALALKRITPPFLPTLEDFGLRNFDREFTELPVLSPERAERLCANFDGFTWEERATPDVSAMTDEV